jgi:hypothetical protein
VEPPHSPSLRNVGPLLRAQLDRDLTEPLPTRWIELILHLNAKEQIANQDASRTSRGVDKR